MASDLDSDSNQKLVYTLKEGNTNNTFRINSGTGLISTINPVVDRERIPLFTLLVEASDMVSSVQLLLFCECVYVCVCDCVVFLNVGNNTVDKIN